jgi:hypothetical protein
LLGVIPPSFSAAPGAASALPKVSKSPLADRPSALLWTKKVYLLELMMKMTVKIKVKVKVKVMCYPPRMLGA